MPDSQKHIYYITGESVSVLEKSPFVEKLKKKGYEVIYMIDAIDEYLVMEVKEFDSKKLMSITRNNELLDTTEEEKKTWDDVVKQNEVFCTKLKGILGDKVMAVKVSNRIVDSPCVLVHEICCVPADRIFHLMDYTIYFSTIFELFLLHAHIV